MRAAGRTIASLARCALALTALAGALALGMPEVLPQDGGGGQPGDGGKGAPGEPTGTRTSPAVAKALEDLAVTPSLAGDVAKIAYAFSPTSEREPRDWVWIRRPDRVKLASSKNVAEGVDGLDIGAGSNAWGKVVHKVEFAPPCSIQLEVFCWYNGPRSNFVIRLCEDKPGGGLAVDWGRQLVSRLGKAVAPAGPPARSEVKAASDYSVLVEVRDFELKATVNGVQTLRAPLEAGEAPAGKIGIEIHDARVIIRSLVLDGRVDLPWAEKAAKKAPGGKKG